MLNRHFIVKLFICVSAILTTSLSFAHTFDDEVIVKGRRVDLSGQSNSASEGLVGQFELTVRPISRIGEIMETVPGMVATQHSGSGKANQYFLRGFNLDHGTDFATWYDGMPVNMRTHGHGQGYTDISFIIPELVKKVSYKKGSYYAEIGDFSAAGAAQFTSFDELDKGLFQLGAGQDGYSRMLLMDSPDAEKRWLYALELQTYDGPWTDIEEDVDKLNAVLRRHWVLDDGEWGFMLMHYDNTWSSADQIPLRAVEQGLIDPFGSIDNTLGGESSRSSLSVNWENELWQISAYAISYDLNLWSNFTYLLDDQVNGDQFEQVDDRTIYGGQVHYQVGEKNKNTFGLELRLDDIDEVALYKTNRRNRIGAIRSDAVEELSVGLYWQGEFTLTDALRLNLGARYDYYDFDVSGLIDQNINGVQLAANSGSKDDDIFSIKSNLSYKLNDTWELYVSAGQGLHSNDARGTTIQVDPADGSTVDPVDPLVRSVGGELGARAFLTDKLNASFALWLLRLDKELLFVGDAGTTESSRESERDGFEATIYYSLTDNWGLDFEYAYANSEFSEPDPGDPTLGNEIPGALSDVASIGLVLSNPAGWYGSLRWRYFGERPLDENNSVRSDPSSVFNLRAGYQWQQWKLTLDILNLSDSNDHDIDYFYESRLTGEPQGVEDIHYHIIEPRTIRAYLQYRF